MHIIKSPLYPKKNNLVLDAFYPTFIKWIRFLCYMMQHHLTCACQAVYPSCVSFFFFQPHSLVTMNSLIEEILGPLQYNIHGDEACQEKSYNDDLLQSMALDVDNMNLMLSNHGMFDDMMLDDKFYPDTATTTTTINDTTLQQVLIDGLTMLPPPSLSASSIFEESSSSLTYITGDGGETETEATSLGYHSSPSLSSSDLMELPSSVLPPSSQENDTWASFFHHEDDDDDNDATSTGVLQEREQHMSLPGPTVSLSSSFTTSHPEMLIRNRGEEYTVIIMSGRVAQKSYGTEKR